MCYFHCVWRKKQPETRKSVHFSRSVVSDSLRPHKLQHARPPCPSPTPRVHPNPCPSSRWCHPNILSSVIPFSSCHQSFSSIRIFSTESALRTRWPKYWSFSFNIGPSNEHSGLISFRMDWLDLLANQGPYGQIYGFSSSHVRMWELDHKESWVPKNWCFWTGGVGKDSWESPGLQGDQTSQS